MAHHSSSSEEVKMYKRHWYNLAYCVRDYKKLQPHTPSFPSNKRIKQLYKRFLRTTIGVTI